MKSTKRRDEKGEKMGWDEVGRISRRRRIVGWKKTGSGVGWGSC